METSSDLELMTSTMEEVMNLPKENRKKILASTDVSLLARMCVPYGWNPEEIKASLDDKQREEFIKYLADVRVYEALDNYIKLHSERIVSATKIFLLKKKIFRMHDDECTRAEDLYSNVAYCDSTGEATDEAAMYADEVRGGWPPISGGTDGDEKAICDGLTAARGIALALEHYADEHSGRKLFTPAIKELRALASGNWKDTDIEDLRGWEPFTSLISSPHDDYVRSEYEAEGLIRRIEDYFEMIDARKADEERKASQSADGTSTSSSSTVQV